MPPPTVIYLQYFDEEGDPFEDGITWCVDRINKTDLVYVLQDSIQSDVKSLSNNGLQVIPEQRPRN